MKLLSSLFVIASAMYAQTAEPPILLSPNVQTFGMIGLAEGQVAQLNLLNPGVPAPAATAAMCSALVTFLDDQGATLKSATITVIPTKSAQFDLDSDADLKLAVNARKQIRATVQIPPVVPPAGSPLATCTLIPTLEIYDRATGKTQSVLEQTRSILPVLVPATRP